MNKNVFTLSFIFFSVPSLLICLELLPPQIKESTDVLPRNIGSPQFLQVLTLRDQRFDPNGDKKDLGDRLNRRVGWNDVLSSQGDEAERNLIKSILRDQGISLDGTPGSTTGIAKARIDVSSPILAFGFTEKLTLAVAVPIVHIDNRIDTGYVRSEDGQKFIDAVCELSPEKCNDAAEKLNHAMEKKLRDLGYAPVQSTQKSAIADMQLIAKYRLYQNEEKETSAKLGFVLPTGEGADPNSVIDLSTGDTRFKVKTGVIEQWPIVRDLAWIGYGEFGVLLPYQAEKRLPLSETEFLSSDKEVLHRGWGTDLILGSYLQYAHHPFGMVANLGYQFQQMSPGDYSGDSSEAASLQRYQLLNGLEPKQQLHCFTAGITFSTTEWYQANHFPVPFRLAVAYNHPLSGRNVPSSDLYSVVLNAFF